MKSSQVLMIVVIWLLIIYRLWEGICTWFNRFLLIMLLVWFFLLFEWKLIMMNIFIRSMRF